MVNQEALQNNDKQKEIESMMIEMETLILEIKELKSKVDTKNQWKGKRDSILSKLNSYRSSLEMTMNDSLNLRVSKMGTSPQNNVITRRLSSRFANGNERYVAHESSTGSFEESLGDLRLSDQDKRLSADEFRNRLMLKSIQTTKYDNIYKGEVSLFEWFEAFDDWCNNQNINDDMRLRHLKSYAISSDVRTQWGDMLTKATSYTQAKSDLLTTQKTFPFNKLQRRRTFALTFKQMKRTPLQALAEWQRTTDKMFTLYEYAKMLNFNLDRIPEPTEGQLVCAFIDGLAGLTQLAVKREMRLQSNTVVNLESAIHTAQRELVTIKGFNNYLHSEEGNVEDLYRSYKQKYKEFKKHKSSNYSRYNNESKEEKTRTDQGKDVRKEEFEGNWRSHPRRKSSKYKDKRRCHYCDKEGHIERFCRKKLKDQKAKKYANKIAAIFSNHDEMETEDSSSESSEYNDGNDNSISSSEESQDRTEKNNASLASVDKKQLFEHNRHQFPKACVINNPDPKDAAFDESSLLLLTETDERTLGIRVYESPKHSKSPYFVEIPLSQENIKVIGGSRYRR